jgi:hypothetical protein
MGRYEEIGEIIYSIVDISLTVITAVLALLILLYVFIEPDGLVNDGWDAQAQALIAELVFCFLLVCLFVCFAYVESLRDGKAKAQGLVQTQSYGKTYIFIYLFIKTLIYRYK